MTGTLFRLVNIALVILAGVVVYSNTMQVDFIMDDYATVSFHGPKDILSILLHGGPRRVADATFAFNYGLHGLQVTGYHLVNLAIHLAAALTLYFTVISAFAALRSSFTDRAEDTDRSLFAEGFVPLSVSLLFVVHPIQTQAVTYIVQRYTSLATLFYLLAALLFIRARLSYDREGMSARSLTAAGGVLIAGVLALGSKQIAATLPLMLIILEASLFRGRLLDRRFFIGCGTAILLAVAILLTVWHDRPLGDLLTALHNATAEQRTFSRMDYFLTQTRVVATYLRLLVLPYGQSLFHDYPVSTTLFSLPVIAALTLHISLITAALLIFRRSGAQLASGKRQQGELQRLAALGIVWFYVAMIVESSIFPITDKIFEHRIYLPSAGFFLSVASLAALAVRRARAAWVLLAAACIVLGGLTIARNNLWGDSMALWQDTARKAPDKDLVQANLAGEYMKLGRPEQALPYFVRALELNSLEMVRTKVHLGMTLKYLGIDRTRFTTGEEILSSWEAAGSPVLGRAEMDRLQVIMYNNLGLAYENLGQPDKAGGAYRSALNINPAYDLAWYNLGLLSLAVADRGQAAVALGHLQRLNPALAAPLAAAMRR